MNHGDVPLYQPPGGRDEGVSNEAQVRAVTARTCVTPEYVDTVAQLPEGPSKMVISQRSARCLRMLATVAAIVATLVLASCDDGPDIYTVKTEVLSDGEVVRTPTVVTVGQARRLAEASGPRAVVEESTWDFGRMDPQSTGRHLFAIHNRGDQPLELAEGTSTCKCTVSKLSHTHVAPGDSTNVVVQWNTGRDRLYRQSATIFSNDPRNKVLTLTVRGNVRALMRAAEEELVLPRCPAGESKSISTVIYSHVWDSLSIEKVDTGHARVVWSLERLEGDELKPWAARSGVKVRLTIPPDLSPGWFSIPIRISGRPAGTDVVDGTSAQDCELTLRGKVLRRLAIYGPEVDSQGVVHLGRWRQGNSRHIRLLVKVRDKEPRLPVTRTQVVPGFMKTAFTPAADVATNKGLYYLTIDIPHTAPSYRPRPGQRGHVRFEFDHARIHELSLPVDITITARDTGTGHTVARRWAN